MHSQLIESLAWPFKRRASTIILFYAILLICAFLATRHMNVPSLAATRLIKKAIPGSKQLTITTQPQFHKKTPPFPLQCTPNTNQTCPSNYYPTTFNPKNPSTRTCPEYFKWIHEDLRPWRANGITREMVEAAKEYAFFRLVVVDGKVYWEKYKDAYQTRDVFTIWGILQLLRLYPGKLPDLDIMFEAGDVPVVYKSNYTGHEWNAPPLFHYCGDDQTLDIVFPDWSFWGWPEINIKGWKGLKKDLAQGNKKVPWMNRLPFAFWKGNAYMGDRSKLLECNSTEQWNAQIATQDWEQETKLGYKIYIEGIAWSVSEKYILACDSLALLVTPKWYEFFTRSLIPMKHYWPINPDPENLCKSIKFAVDWGNKHKEKAQKIGKAGSKFVQEQLVMDNVYDYMFHLLNEYAKLLKYKPSVPPEANETCSEDMVCSEEGLQREFRLDNMVHGPSTTNPCILQPPQEPQVIKAFLEKQDSVRRRVDGWVAKGSASGDL
ncbi:O-glucosyltransferase rumi [Bienertia sinuspersici]